MVIGTSYEKILFWRRKINNFLLQRQVRVWTCMPMCLL